MLVSLFCQSGQMQGNPIPTFWNMKRTFRSWQLKNPGMTPGRAWSWSSNDAIRIPWLFWGVWLCGVLCRLSSQLRGSFRLLRVVSNLVATQQTLGELAALSSSLSLCKPCLFSSSLDPFHGLSLSLFCARDQVYPLPPFLFAFWLPACLSF